MTRYGRFAVGPLVVLAGAVLTGGCRHPGQPAGSALPGEATGRADLKPRQVADVQFAYARSLEKSGELDQARARYSEAVKHDPGRADAWHRLAILHDRKGQF